MRFVGLRLCKSFSSIRSRVLKNINLHTFEIEFLETTCLGISPKFYYNKCFWINQSSRLDPPGIVLFIVGSVYKSETLVIGKESTNLWYTIRITRLRILRAHDRDDAHLRSLARLCRYILRVEESSARMEGRLCARKILKHVVYGRYTVDM